MANEISCPIINIGIVDKFGNMGFKFASCMRMKCAWYDAFREQCSVISILQKLSVNEVKDASKNS
jgi:hypothetical protein